MNKVWKDNDKLKQKKVQLNSTCARSLFAKYVHINPPHLENTPNNWRIFPREQRCQEDMRYRQMLRSQRWSFQGHRLGIWWCQTKKRTPSHMDCNRPRGASLHVNSKQFQSNTSETHTCKMQECPSPLFRMSSMDHTSPSGHSVLRSAGLQPLAKSQLEPEQGNIALDTPTHKETRCWLSKRKESFLDKGHNKANTLKD